uniref:Tetratricopeptide repeat protein 12 n=1 Tax=Otus sunia TaxID=257818 RepID=A0A8C8ECT4_9STRI
EKIIAETEKRLHEQETIKEEETKTIVNRTVINTQASVRDGFLAVLEKDAKERAKRRKRNEHLANALKEKGNDAFRKGDYDIAIQRYTEGLEKLKDKQELYTNRAQAYLKMHEYEKAIGDCEWALKCNGKCIKAYFLMGKAHLALKHYSESKQCYEKILQIDPQKKSLFEVKDEERAMKEVQSGKLTALSIKELLQKLDRPDQNILYYTGGIRLLTGAMTDCTEQTLFRTNNGFSILNDNEVVRREKKKCNGDAIVCVALLLDILFFSEENLRLLLTQPDVNAQLPKLLSSGVLEIQKETLALISLYSENENGRRLLVRHQDLTKWLQILMAFVNSTDARASSAMNILSGLLVNQAALACCIGIMGTLCADVVIRMQMAECKEYWQACLKLVVKKLDSSLEQCFQPYLLWKSHFMFLSGQINILFFLLSHCFLIKRAIGVLSRILCPCSLLDSENEMIVGNAAFCLGQCLVVPGAATSLLNSNVVMILLKHAGGDATRTLVQENAAISLGKLCVAEPRHIFQLRKLNGLAILNSSMKYMHNT